VESHNDLVKVQQLMFRQLQGFAYFGFTREYVVVHVLREAHKLCIAMSVTLGIAAVQKIQDTLIGAELVQKML